MSMPKNINLYCYANEIASIYQKDGCVTFSQDKPYGESSTDYDEEFDVVENDTHDAGGVTAIFPQDVILPALNMAVDMVLIDKLESLGVTLSSEFVQALKHVGVFREYCLNVLLYRFQNKIEANVILESIGTGFVWKEAPKGPSYWRSVSIIIEKYMTSIKYEESP